MKTTQEPVVQKNLFQKILTVYQEVTSVMKDAEIAITKDRSYEAVTHDAVTAALHMPLAINGIFPKPTQKSCVITTFEKEKEWNGKVEKSTQYRADVTAEVTYINADNPTETFTSEATAYAFDTSDKAVGKAYSMAIKMIHMKTFMLESLDREEERVEEGATYKQKLAKPLEDAKNPYIFMGGVFQGKKFEDVMPEDFDAELKKYEAVPTKSANLAKLIDNMKKFKATKGQKEITQ